MRRYLALLLLLALAGSGWGASQAPDAAQIEALRQTIESSTLEEKDRKQALEWLGQALQWLQQAQATEAKQRRLQETVRQAPRRLREIGTLLERPERLARSWPPLRLERPLEQLEVQLAEEEAARNKTTTALQTKEQELAQLVEFAAQGSKRIAALEQQLAEVARELENLPENPADPLQRARRLSLEARRHWLEAQLALLRLQQSHLDLLTKLTRAERDLLRLEAAEHRSRSERLRQAVALAREHKVLSASSTTELALRTAAPEVQPLYEENLELWQELEHLLAEGKHLKHRIDALQNRLTALQRDFERIRQAVELTGTDEAIAAMLSQRLRSLPNLDSFRREGAIRRTRLKQAVVRRFEIEEALRQLEDIDALIEASLAQLPPDLPPGRRAILRLQLREALENRREALQTLQQEYTRYLSSLSKLDALEHQFYEQVQAYRRFLQRQLLWIPYRRLRFDRETLLGPLKYALEPSLIQDRLRQLAVLARRDPGPPAALSLALLVLLFLQRRAARDLTALGQATRSIRSDRFSNTLRALIDTLILAAPLPLLLFGAGLWLRRHSLTEPELTPLAAGLLLAGRPAAAFGILRQLCRPEGLAQRHLRWLQVTRESLWFHLRWFLPWAVLCAFTVGITGSPSLTPASLGLGRLSFALFMLTSTVLIWKLWHRHSPILNQLEASRPSWVVRYHGLWFYPALAVPLELAAAALAGYYYAAFYLAEKAFRTLWFFLALMLVKDLLLRWLYVTERHLRYQEILRRREELRRQRAEEAAATELPPVEEPEVDFGRLSEQTRRLFRIGFFIAGVAGLWWIWQDAIPALNLLKEITLPITTRRLVGGVPKEVPLTLADVTSGILLGILTMLAARNLPGLLEFAVLRHLPLSQGGRYAWSALTQYLITAVGIYLICGALGIQWSEIQWLVAAMSVGLGFGLQEVVANFVSGLILLFERPIRVGDVVTIGDTTGTVSRIRIRATTILNWDRQELVIPNKNFITGEFINWTLTDTINRIVIQIGVAYGCNVEKAMAIVRETARAHPEVLDDPAPLITFESFGDNSLLIILRAYLGTLDNRLSTITDLHRQIYQRLNEAGIEIAFPQRDVHLDSKGPLEVVVRRDQRTSSS
ncbi:potassium-dependent mechanosensitive channel [Methylomarinovum caldicuralii]|uniref:Potassium-dependent mechanosensitive channel n=1 Tax=Methylomarinovum caldicuralii TaxID=438856 RepID=A0AAU9C704_9GAMM|nr:mechanosensitive ion channel domain-containing protein [Methylomarinovum caldicuralii]BCX81764.1 potassium-dependent mechanosensitive channel [Methylomarinovum caldicuralii]